MILTPKNTKRCRVFLDGIEVKDVYYIDTDKRVAGKYLRDEKGHFVFAGDEVLSEEVSFREYRLEELNET